MATFVESFEDVPVTANSPVSAFNGFVQVGILGVFNFFSGAQYVHPVPNNNASTATLVGDFDLHPSATWGLSANGKVRQDQVPDGTAYIGRNSPGNGEIGFGFTTDVFSVGAYVDGVETRNLGFAAYDVAGRLISAASVRSVDVDLWDQNYIQVVSKVPIAKVVLTGDAPVLDLLTFSTDTAHTINGTKRDDRVDGKHKVGGEKSTNAVDLIFGKKGDDKLVGRGGDDTLDGGKNADILKGGDGNDTLIGGKGPDKLFGGAGQDTLLFNTTIVGRVDKIRDFDPIDDTIVLAKSIFPELRLGSLDAIAFHVGAVAADGSDRILYDSGNGSLYYDSDGTGGADAVRFAKIDKFLPMTEADFIIA